MTNNATVLISENILKATADAIRNKGGASGSIKPVNFAETIKAIAACGEQATPEISLDSSSGLITATAGIKSSTYQLAFQAAKTITPGTVSQIAISSGYYAGGNVTVAGDSNLVAGNIKSGVSIFGVSGTLESGGETSVDDVSRAIIERTVTEISDDKLQIIGSQAFYRCSNLVTASFPACTSISASAFYSCSKLTTISFPICTAIGASAFYACFKLTTASFPACTWMGQAAFLACSSLTTASFPTCTSIAESTFFGCSNLSTISFPACTTIGKTAFYSCSKLTTASFPACTSISASAFYCCYSLSTASFPTCTMISASAFRSCRTLSILQLGASSICTLSNSNTFSSTPFAGYSAYFSGTPYIYVPSSLITAYQSATNWTYFSSYFSSIESLEQQLITFTINGVEYQAKDGMTWDEWIESEYNVNNYYINGSTIWCDFDNGVVYSVNNVVSSDIIIENTSYHVTEYDSL